jgi:hypothetical protein
MPSASSVTDCHFKHNLILFTIKMDFYAAESLIMLLTFLILNTTAIFTRKITIFSKEYYLITCHIR